MLFLLPTAREGYVFTGVCHSVHNRPYGHSVTAYPCWLLGRYASYRNAFLLPAATKLGQGNVFTGVCNSVHRGGLCLSASWDTPPRADTPRSRHPPRADTPPSPREADSGIRSTSGRYASYWNAFLFLLQWRLEKSVLKRFQFTTVIGVMGLFTNALYKRDPTKITNSNVFQSKNL